MNTKKVLTPILVAILALGAVSSIGIKSPIQQAAAASVLIATSADSHGGKFFGEGVLQVVVTDPDKDDDSTQETIQVTLQGDPESGSSASKTFTIPETSKSSSKFEFYLQHEDASAVANADLDAINNQGVHDYPPTSLNEAPMIRFGPTVSTSSGLHVDSSMYELTHFTMTVGDTEAKVDYDDSKSSISLDRTTYGSDNKMHIFMTDQDANRNPTTAETISVSQSDLNTKLFSMTGATFVDDVDFKETGDNTAQFEAIVTLNDADTATNQELKYTTKGVQVTLNDKWDYYNLGSSTNDNATSTSDISFTVDDTDGSVNDVGTVTFGSELPITIVDNDRNIDSETRDTLPGRLVISTESGSDSVTVNMKETGDNTGIFMPDVSNGEVKVTFDNAANTGDSVLQITPGTATDDIIIKYNDTRSDSSTWKVFTKRVSLNLGNPSVELPQSAGINDDVKLTITDPNLNDNSRTKDTYTFTLDSSPDTGTVSSNNAQYALLRGSTNLKGFATIEVDAQGSNPTFSGTQTYTLVETDVNSGVFTTTLHMDDILSAAGLTSDVSDGDQFRMTLHDYFDDQSREISDSLAIGKPTTGVEFSRTVLPVPPTSDSSEADLLNSETSKTTVILTDGDENKNSNNEDAIPWVWVSDLTGGKKGPAFEVKVSGSGVNEDIKSHTGYSTSKLASIVPGLEDITLKETGKSTGVFSEEIPFVYGDLGANSWQDLKVTVVYFDGGGDDESNGITFRSNDGTVSSNVDSVSASTQVTLTVQDEDLNLDDGKAEEFQSSSGQSGTWLVSVETEDDKVKDVSGRTFRETGPDTGIFTATFTVGDDILVTAQDTNGKIKQASNIHVEYNDEWDSSGNSGDSQELDLPVVTSTGAIQVSPDLVGPGTDIKVMITDSDLNKDSNGANSYPDASFVTFRSDRKEVGSANPKLEETGANTGVFTFDIQLTTDRTACKDDDLSASKFKAEGGSNPTMGACPGDIISIKYDDAQTAAGQKMTVSKTVEVKSFDPEMKTEKDSYNIGDKVVVTISDPDANRDPDVADSLKDVRVYSTSDAVGQTLSALETGKDTGVFKLSFGTSKTSQGGSVQVQQGDDVTVRYTDDFPANFVDSEKKKDFTYNVVMEGSTGTNATTPTVPSLKDVTGKTLSEVSAGQQVVLSTQVHNNNDAAQPFVAIVEVRDSNGVTVYLAWQTGMLNAGGQAEVGLSWTPDSSGQYTCRTFILSSLSTPTVLSTVKESNISVS